MCSLYVGTQLANGLPMILDLSYINQRTRNV
jgi:hypothetical protein